MGFAWQTFVIVTLGVFLAGLGPWEGSLEHASRTDVSITASSLMDDMPLVSQIADAVSKCDASSGTYHKEIGLGV